MRSDKKTAKSDPQFKDLDALVADFLDEELGISGESGQLTPELDVKLSETLKEIDLIENKQESLRPIPIASTKEPLQVAADVSKEESLQPVAELPKVHSAKPEQPDLLLSGPMSGSLLRQALPQTQKTEPKPPVTRPGSEQVNRLNQGVAPVIASQEPSSDKRKFVIVGAIMVVAILAVASYFLIAPKNGPATLGNNSVSAVSGSTPENGNTPQPQGHVLESQIDQAVSSGEVFNRSRGSNNEEVQSRDDLSKAPIPTEVKTPLALQLNPSATPNASVNNVPSVAQSSVKNYVLTPPRPATDNPTALLANTSPNTSTAIDISMRPSPNIATSVANQPLPPPPDPPASSAASHSGTAETPKPNASPSRVGGTVSAAMAISKVPPVYPEFARKMNITGTVEVNISVDEEGRVVQAKAVSGPAALRGAAEEAVKEWRFDPILLNGVRIPGQGKISVVFNDKK